MATWRRLRSYTSQTLGIDALKKYALKPHTRVRGPWADKPLPKEYTGKDLPTTLYPWQQEILDRCLEEPDDRTINYIIDPVGNTGKSKFVKYMGFHHGALFLPWGRAGDLLNYITENKDAGIFMFDLSRTKPADWARDDISTCMEYLKNGQIVNLKYKTCGVNFDPPHVWVFSNQPPNFESMSRDRWRLWTIDALRQLVPWKPRRRGSEDLVQQQHGSPKRSLTQPIGTGRFRVQLEL